MIVPVMVSIACLLDLIVGDPPMIPHPVTIIGKFIDRLERLLFSPGKILGIAGGAALALIVVGSVYALTAAFLWLLRDIHPVLALAVETWLLSTTIAAKGLAEAAKKVFIPLSNNDLETARKMVGHIVGRDTFNLDRHGVTRATVETVAENTVDGIIAPLFYAFIGGAPLAMAYKAVNTLDSMVGYKNERYLYFGRFSARLDDVINYIPARIGGFLLLAASLIMGKNTFRAFKTLVRDSGKHPSPNSGIPEAVVAGSLGVRLGGMNFYQGKESFRQYIGEDINPLAPGHIKQAISMMYVSSALALAIGVIAYSVYLN